MRWQFVRLGGVDQVAFRSAEDVLNLPELDQKLWVALACPIDDLAIDRRTLELIDTQKDGRIRASELVEAVRWFTARIEPNGVDKKSDQLSSSSLKQEARDRLGEIVGQSISLQQVEALLKEFASRPL